MEDKDLGQRILKFLSSKPKKCEALNKLVQALKVQKKSLNQCLYKLERQSKVVRVQISPPVWGLHGHVVPNSPQTFVGRTTRSRGKQKLEQKAKDTFIKAGSSSPVGTFGDLVEFQDTQLFKTDTGLDSETESFTGVVGNDDDIDLNSEFNDDSCASADQLFSNDKGIVDSADVHVSEDILMDVEMKTETEIVIRDNESDRVNRIRMVEDDDSESIKSQGFVNNESERTLYSPLTNEIKTNDDDEKSDAKDCREMLSDPEVEFDDLDLEQEATDRCRAVQVKLEIEEKDNFASLSNVSQSQTEHDQSTPYVNNGTVEAAGKDQYETEDQSEDNLNKTVDIDNKIKEMDSDMENCDKILKVLSLLPGVVQFVLVNKTKLAKEDIEIALEKCKSLGFVSGCSNLWKITPEGIDYIESKSASLGVEKSVSDTRSGIPFNFNQSTHLCQSGTVHNGHFKNQANVTNERNVMKQQQSSALVDIPKGYHAYPNKSTTAQVFANIRSQSGSNNSQRQYTESVFKSSLPPNPRKVLAKNVESSIQTVKLEKQSNGKHTLLQQQHLTQPGSLFSDTVSFSVSQPLSLQSNSLLGHFQSGNVSLQNEFRGFHTRVNSDTVPSKSATEENRSIHNFLLPQNPMEIISRCLKRTEISPPSTPSASPASNQSNLPPISMVPRPPHMLKSGSMSMTGTSQNWNEPMSLGLTTHQHQPMSSYSRNSSVENKFSSLPTNGPVSTNGPFSLALSNESFSALNKNAVSALMEYAQARKMTARVEVISQKGAAHRPTFKMSAFVGKRQFPPVTCNNKKDGRKEACDIALRQLIAEGQFKVEAAGETTGSKPQAALESMTHFDKVAALTHRGFTALVSQITGESFAGRKVIAGLVMKRSDEDTGVLVSLGTGNRCITGQQLSLQGNTVNDSHAEIITRRGFIRFLYKQLLDYDPSKTSHLFERSRTGKLQIKSKISFHLYISTAPCGDGALFSPRDAESSKTLVDTQTIRPPHEPVFSSNVQGLLRTKVEGGEGTIPIEPGFTCQTFDGIQRGERLRTMSCTDKVCRWNVVGMQGALLSHFLEPVYLDSLTLGLLYDHGHLSRAVCCRVGRGPTDIDQLLPTNYRLNHPWLGRVTSCDPPREVQKTKAISINWAFGDTSAEVTDGTTGLCNTGIEKSFFSRLSKRNLYNSYKAVCEKFGRQDLLQIDTYNNSKKMAKDFQQAREAMLNKFKENKYGPWVSKPVEEEMFGWDEQS